MSPDFLWPVFLSVAVATFSVWEVLKRLIASNGGPSWAATAILGGGFALLLAIAVARELLRVIRDRREAFETLDIKQRYPHCHATRLSSGAWFLTDKSTGREYRPDQ